MPWLYSVEVDSRRARPRSSSAPWRRRVHSACLPRHGGRRGALRRGCGRGGSRGPRGGVPRGSGSGGGAPGESPGARLKRAQVVHRKSSGTVVSGRRAQGAHNPMGQATQEYKVPAGITPQARQRPVRCSLEPEGGGRGEQHHQHRPRSRALGHAPAGHRVGPGRQSPVRQSEERRAWRVIANDAAASQAPPPRLRRPDGEDKDGAGSGRGRRMTPQKVTKDITRSPEGRVAVNMETRPTVGQAGVQGRPVDVAVRVPAQGVTAGINGEGAPGGRQGSEDGSQQLPVLVVNGTSET